MIFFFPIDIKTTARRDGDDLIINGSKMWITNGAQADYMCLLANTNQGPAHKSKSLIVLPMNLPGIAGLSRYFLLYMCGSFFIL